jgi:kumamolisin
MRNMKLGARAPLALSALSLAAGLALGVAAPQAMAVIIPKVAPKDLGVASPTQVRTLSLGLAPRNGAALDALVESVADPKSANFRQFLTSAQFAAQFGQTPAAVAQAAAFLQSQGFTVTNVHASNLLITFKGTNAQIAATFGTTIHNYTQGGVAFQAPATAAVMPAQIAGVSVGVSGMGTRALPMSYARTAPQVGALAGDTVQPALAAVPHDAGNPVGSWTVKDLAAKYNVNPLYAKGLTGAGKTIGIATLATYDQADAYAYWAALGLSVDPNRITDVIVDAADGAPGSDGSEETTLDVEQSGGLAPGAKMRVYIGPNAGNGFLETFATALDEDMVDVLSASWGSPEIFYDGDPSLALMHNVFKQAAVQGIPVIAASGDSGAYDINRNFPYPDCSTVLTVDYPAADPYVLAAGGTSLPNVSPHKHGTVTQPYERPWGGDYMKNYITQWYGLGLYYTSYLPEGGGGGVSVLFSRPSYQNGLAGVQNSASAQSLLCGPALTGAGYQDWYDMPANAAGRNLPDVALNADPASGYVVLFGGVAQGGWGGTSFVAPQLNGLLTLISEDITPTAANPKGRMGRPMPKMYAAFKAQGYAAGSPFLPITVGDNEFYKAGPNYNPASGLGSVDFTALDAALK